MRPSSTFDLIFGQLDSLLMSAERYSGTERFPVLDSTSSTGASNTSSSTPYSTPLTTSQSNSTSHAPGVNSNQWKSMTIPEPSYAPQRHTTMFIEPRPAQVELLNARPLSMTALSGQQYFQPQNIRGEALPQAHMPPQIVQPLPITQTSLGHSEPSDTPTVPFRISR